MFFFGRKWHKTKHRVIQMRDEHGVLSFQIVKDPPEPTDKELAETTKTTVTWRRFP